MTTNAATPRTKRYRSKTSSRSRVHHEIVRADWDDLVAAGDAVAKPHASKPKATKPMGSISTIALVALLYVAYAGFYFGKKNYSDLLSVLTDDCAPETTNGTPDADQSINASAPLFGLQKGVAGQIGSGFELANSAVKLASGPAIDASEPAVLLAVSTGLIGVSNFVMAAAGLWVHGFKSASSTMKSLVLSAVWCINGGLQAIGWPALALILSDAVDPSERGMWYSLLSTSQNAGAAVSPWIVMAGRQVIVWLGLANPETDTACGSLAKSNIWYGWVGPLLFPSIVLPLIGVVLWVYLPRRAVEHAHSSSSSSVVQKGTEASARSALCTILKDWRQWAIAFTYLLLSIPRSVISDWGLTAMNAGKREVDDVTAKYCLTALEIGGFVGGVGAGYISDRLFAGKRSWTIVGMMTLTAVLIPFIFYSPHIDRMTASLGIPESFVTILKWFITGAASCGPHVLLGLLARELAPNA